MTEKIRPELSRYFESIEQLSPIVLLDENGEPERKFLVFYLNNYTGG